MSREEGPKPTPESEEIDLEAKLSLGDIREFELKDKSSLLGTVELTPAFKQRHITTLKPVSKWTNDEIANHLKCNRILQSGYSALSPTDIILCSNITKEEWLTDWVCPNVEQGCKLNIAADLITQFRVSAENLNDNVQCIFKWLESKEPSFFNNIHQSIESQITAEKNNILQAAEASLIKHYPDTTQKSEFLPFFIKVETERRRKEITHKTIQSALAPMYDKIAIMSERKRIFEKGQNRDFAFLGAAGSGKSTISTKQLEEANVDKLDCVVLATDDYRGVVMQESDEHIATDQVFIRTQDTAFSIKELVQARLEKQEQRPNIILDCVTLELWHRKLLEKNKQTTTAVACLDDISLAPERAYARAMDEKSGPADKGRHVNTTSLLEGHRDASAKLLSSLPRGVKSTLYDTNVKRGVSQIPSFAIVDLTEGKHEIDVLNLSKLTQFMCKSNVNVEAQTARQLFRKDDTSQTMTFDRHHQAEQLLALVKAKSHPTMPNWSKPAYEITLKSMGIEYAKLKEMDGQVYLHITNAELFRRKWNSDDSDGRVLRSAVMQIHWQSMPEMLYQIEQRGEKRSEDAAIKSLVPNLFDYLKPQKDIPPHIFYVASMKQVPSFDKLTEMCRNGKTNKIEIIPLIIKDENDKLWVYGRNASGSPQLKEISNTEKYASLTFPSNMNKIEPIQPHKKHQSVYNDLAESKSHFYNYLLLRDERRASMVKQHDRLASEYMRQFREHTKVEEVQPISSQKLNPTRGHNR